jgi:hypothetical protein
MAISSPDTAAPSRTDLPGYMIIAPCCRDDQQSVATLRKFTSCTVEPMNPCAHHPGGVHVMRAH